MEVMEKDSGGYSKVGFISRDLYNFVAKYKKKKMFSTSDASPGSFFWLHCVTEHLVCLTGMTFQKIYMQYMMKRREY